MNFKDSAKLLEIVKKSKRVILACHKGADPDSMVSCLLVKRAFQTYGISADIFAPEPIHDFYNHLDPNGEIKTTNFDSFDFSPYDLFFVVDVNELRRFEITKELPQNLTLVNVDHHAGKEFKGEVVINDNTFVSTSEMLFNLLEDWGTELTHEMLRFALIGIASDSDMFNYTTSARLFRTVAKIIDLGVNYEEVAALLWRNNSLEQFRFLAKALSRVKIDYKNKFAYSFIKYEDYSKFNENELIHPTRVAADSFLRTIRNTNFGIVMVEKKKNYFEMSIRSREHSFATLPLVESLGGGGHRDGGGAAIFDMSFKDASKKVLQAARSFAKSSN